MASRPSFTRTTTHKVLNGLDETGKLFLTPRLMYAAVQILKGLDNKEMAKEMGVSVRTAKAYCNQLYQAFGITSGVKRVKLVVILFRNRIQLENMILEATKVKAILDHPETLPEIIGQRIYHGA